MFTERALIPSVLQTILRERFPVNRRQWGENANRLHGTYIARARVCVALRTRTYVYLRIIRARVCVRERGGEIGENWWRRVHNNSKAFYGLNAFRGVYEKRTGKNITDIGASTCRVDFGWLLFRSFSKTSLRSVYSVFDRRV